MNEETRTYNASARWPSIMLIANPAAGRAGDRKIAQLAGYLQSHGASVEVSITEKRGDAREYAMRAARSDKRPDMIVAAGGDGTINEVVNGIAGTEVPMGVIPLGTVNLYALETGIPMDILKACDALLNGIVKKVNVGKVNDRYFILMAGIGFDADVVYRLDLGLKSMIGRLAYVLTGFSRVVSYPFNRLTIEIDGSRTVEGYSIVIGNMKYYGGKISVTPRAGFEKQSLDICVFKGKGTLNMLKYTWGVLRKAHLGFRDVEYSTVRSILVSSPKKTYIQVDGDIFGTLPAVFHIAEEMVSVVLPPGYAQDPLS